MIGEIAAADRILFVHAHPDDETIQTGAMIAGLKRRGKQITVLTATRGERGEALGEAADLDTEALVRLRTQELYNALDRLGVDYRLFLGSSLARAAGRKPRRYEDSGMRWIAPSQAGPADDVSPAALCAAEVSEVAADIHHFMTIWRPDVVVSYADDGSYGHPDHVFVHHATAAAARRLGIAFVEIVVDPDDPHATWADYSAARRPLLAALACHGSQLSVGEDGITHVGGQFEPFHTRIGLKVHPA